MTRSPDRSKRADDLLFVSSITKEHRNILIKDVYSTLATTFDKSLDRMGGVYAEFEDGPNIQITVNTLSVMQAVPIIARV